MLNGRREIGWSFRRGPGSALGLTIPVVAYLAIVVPDFLDQFEEAETARRIKTRLDELLAIGLVDDIATERLAFGPLMPPVIGGGAFGWLLFKP